MRKFYSPKFKKCGFVAFVISVLSFLPFVSAIGQITQRGTATTATSTSGNNITINKPTGVVAGDVMIAIISKSATSSNSSLAGWTLISGTRQGSGSRYTTVLYRVADGTEGASFNFYKGTNQVNAAGAIMAFSGVDPNSSLDASSNLVGSAGNTATANSITTSASQALVIFLGGTGASSWSSWSGSNPTFTEVLDYNNGTVGVGASIGTKTPAGNTGSRQVTLDGNYYYAVMLLALKPLAISTTTTITSISPSSFVYGTNSTTFTATVSPNPGGGTVQFKVDGTNVGSAVTVSGGTATLNYNPSALGVGTHSVAAVYSGNGNYAGSTATAVNLTITPKPISVTGISANNKTYDGNASATFTGGTSPDIINGDVVTYSATGSFDTKNAGTGKTVTISGVTLGDADAGNYSVSSYPSSATANINPKPLTAASTVSKVYDATNAAVNVSVGTVTGYVPSENLIITATATDYANPNVGTNKATTISYSLSNGTNGGLASNYSMADKAITTGVISKRPISVTAITNTKIYDGTTSATSIPTITSGSLAGSDAGTFTETYDNKNAGTGKTLTPTGSINDGNSGGNYDVTYNSTNGVITKQPITVTATANTKVYDGNTTAAASPTISGTIFTGDIASFSESYDNKNAGSGKTLTPTGSINDGNSGGNYDVSFVPVNTGVINPKAITVTAVSNNKPYDGNTSAAGVPTINAGGIQTGDTPGFIETYDNKNAGTGKVLTPSGTVNDGNSGNNYTYNFVNNNTGVINSLVLTYVANSATRVYGVANPPLSGTVTGFISGENIANATSGTPAWNTTAVITSPVASYPITGSGLTANNGNYTFAQAAANTSAFTITKADLTITPDNQTKCAGSPFSFSGTEFTSTGLVNGDAIASVTLTSTGTPAGAAPAIYPIVSSAATGSGLTNYNITYNSTSTLTVNPRPTAQITSANTAICNPGSTNITGTVTANGAWTLTLSDGKTATGNGNGTFSIAVTPVVNTTYTITSLVDAFTCPSITTDLTGSTIVTVNHPIVITTQPNPSQKVCGSTNTPVSFTVIADGDGKTYQWYKDDLSHPVGTNSSTYTISNPVAANAGNYFVVVSGLSPCASVTSDMAELIVNQAITLTPINPLTQTICEDGSATFSVSATGTGLSFYWQHAGNTLSTGGNISIVSDATSSTLTLNPVSSGDAGTYHLIVNGDDNVCPQALSNPDATLTVNKKPANPASATASVPVICAGNSTTLTLNGGGGGTGEVIHWYTGPNGTGSAVGTGKNLSVNPGTTTTYYGRYEVGTPCSMNSADAIVTVSVDPVSVGGTAAMTNQQVCVGSVPSSDITLSGNVGAIQWQKSTTATFTSPVNIVGAVNPTLTSSQIGTVSGTIYIRAKVTSGVCTVAYSNVITITANALPTVNSVSPVTSCGNDNITLTGTASAGATIDWYTSATGGTLVGTGLSFTTTISATTIFYAEARNTTTGCTSVGRTPAVATYKPKPDVQVSSTTQTICSEDAIATINITNPNNTTGTNFSWKRDNTVNVTGIPDGTGSSISGTLTNTTNIQQPVTFTVTPAANGCVGNSITATVVVNPKPIVTVINAPDAVCFSSAISITYNNPNNVSGTVLSWERNSPSGVQAGQATSGIGNIIQTLVNMTGSNITVTYTLKATSPDGCFSSVTKDIVLYPEFKSDGFDITHGQTICLGASAAPLTVLVPVTGGSAEYSYQWQRATSQSGPWTVVGNGTSYSPGEIGLSTYLYRLILTDNKCGSSATSPVTSVVPGWGLEINASPLSDPPGPLCSGDNFQMNIKTKSIAGIFGINTLNFKWSASGGIVSAIDTHENSALPQNQAYGYIVLSGPWYWRQSTLYGDANFTVTNTSNSTIHPVVNIAASNGNCTFSPVVVNLTVYPVPTMQTPVQQTICSGSPAGVNLKGNITDANTTFIWTAELQSGNASGFSTSASPGNSGEVSPGNTFTIPEVITNNGSIQAVVKYTITPMANGCINGVSQTVLVYINPTPTISINNPTAICAPSTVDLTANSVITGSTSGLSYTYWKDATALTPLNSPNAVNTTGTYYIKGTISSSGCYDIKAVNVVVNPQIPVSVSITNTSRIVVCKGEAISFSATPTNGGASPRYQWQVNGSNVAGANSSTFSSTTLTTGDKVTVVLTSNPAPTCATETPATSNEITVTVNPLLPVSVKINSDETTICSGETITFTTTVENGGSNPVYQWYVNGNAVTGANSATFSSTTLQNNDVVTVGLNSDASPCATGNPATSTGITVTVNPILNVAVSISADKTSICVGDEVTFTATPINGGTTPIYQWKLNGANVGSNSATYTNNTLSNNDKVTCVLTSNASPCGYGSPAASNVVTITIKPNAIPGTIVAPGGGTNLCVGGTSYTYVVTGNNAAGTWSSSDETVFTVNSAGKVTALKAGQATLIYIVTTDCSTDHAEMPLTVGATPANPGPISGNILACSTNSGNTYSVTNVAGLTYNWSLPTGWTFTGQGTNEITITAAGSSGNISVNAVTSTYACSASPSSTLAVTVTTPGQWLGTTSSDWNTASNWGCATVPVITTNVSVPVVTSPNFYPVVQTAPAAMAHNISIASGASLIVNGQTLQISGAITNAAGTFDATNGTLEFNGSTTQTIDGSIFNTRTIKNLIVSNDDLKIATTTNDTLNITGLVSFGTGTAQLNTGDNLTLKSTKDNTASIGEIGTSNAVNGKVEVERYISIGSDGTHGKSWQFLATPTQGQTLKQSWMEGGVIPTSPNGYGAQLTGTAASSGYDAPQSVAPSVKSWDEGIGNWKEFTNANSLLYSSKGYFVFVRGDRTVSSPTAPATPTTLRSKGKILTGPQSVMTNYIQSPHNVFFSVGNPYPSAVNMTNVKATVGVSSERLPFYYVWNPTATGDYGVGGWNLLNWKDEDGGHYFTVPGNQQNDMIQSGQAIMVQLDEVDPTTVTFKEGDKSSSSNNVAFREQSVTGKSAQLVTNLFALSTNGNTVLADGTLQLFDKSYSDKLDRYDARKIMNGANNLAIKTSDVNLVVERRAPLTEQDTIRYNMSSLAKQNYRLEFKAQGLSSEGVEGFVEDNYLNTRTPLNMEGTTHVDFAVTSDKGSYAANRFRIVFKTAVVLPVKFVSVTAAQEDENIRVDWKVENENAVKQYDVEKSVDGVSYKKAYSVAAANNGAGSYNWLDEQATPGDNYYRIRMEDESGKISYSDVVKVVIPLGKPSIGIYPNPITDGIIHLQLVNQPKGRYGLRLLNPLGQTIIAKQIEHAGGNATEDIKWNYHLAHGVYQLQVLKPDGKTEVIKVMY